MIFLKKGVLTICKHIEIFMDKIISYWGFASNNLESKGVLKLDETRWVPS